MESYKLRKKFLDFFKHQKHVIVSSSSLIPQDSSVLFTTAGMQQFKNYYLGEKSPYGENVVSCQQCFRTSDIEEVGDNSHLTFLEMLGNFSFGGYFKEEAIKLAYELLISNFQLSISKITVTVFGGDNEVPRDEESVRIWSKFGFSEENGNLRFASREDNFWGPTGEEGPCGPTTEIHLNDTEIWNIVFNEYYQDKEKKLTPLEQKGVDTGMGLERLAMVCQKKTSVFETDLFEPITAAFQKYRGRTPVNLKAERIITDHIKSAVFLISEGILPSNVERGYVLRRILRRAIRYGKLLNLPKNFLIPLAQKVIEIYKDIYPEVKFKQTDILTVIQNEEEKFEKTLERGLKEFKKYFRKPVVYWEDKEDEKKFLERAAKEQKIMSGFVAFRLFATYGFPIELIKEIAIEEGIKVDEDGFRVEMLKHQEVSRAGAEKKFKGGLADTGEQVIKYHTATHLLLAALREILGPEIYQKGSNITTERLRFDFNYQEKLSEEQIKKVEELVNQKIQENITVEMMELPKNEALKMTKISFDPSKYSEIVKVYKINDFSIELCGGPHVDRTGKLGSFKIVKEESSGAGIRRIRAVLDSSFRSEL